MPGKTSWFVVEARPQFLGMTPGDPRQRAPKQPCRVITMERSKTSWRISVVINTIPVSPWLLTSPFISSPYARHLPKADRTWSLFECNVATMPKNFVRDWAGPGREGMGLETLRGVKVGRKYSRDRRDVDLSHNQTDTSSTGIRGA